VFLALLAGAPAVIGILWLVNLSGDGSQEKVRRDTCIGALVVSVLFIVGAVVYWFVPVETSNDAQGSFGASAVVGAALLVSGILGLVLTLILRLTMPGEARVDRR
jgi:protein-S-isoprenylcysteine O-methyltransferase Ste14